jgi:Cu2+-exporting ATPase
MKKLKLQIQNLTCAGCVPEIEQVMREQIGVIWATINFAAGEVSIIYDPAVFDSLRLIRAVNSLGFELTRHEELPRHSPVTPRDHKPFARMQQWVRILSR